MYYLPKFGGKGISSSEDTAETVTNFLMILSCSTQPFLLILTLFQIRQCCVDHVKVWMESNKLKLNEEKRKAMVVSSWSWTIGHWAP